MPGVWDLIPVSCCTFRARHIVVLTKCLLNELMNMWKSKCIFFSSFLAVPWHMEFLGQVQLQPMPQLLQHWILNPLSQARD